MWARIRPIWTCGGPCQFPCLLSAHLQFTCQTAPPSSHPSTSSAALFTCMGAILDFLHDVWITVKRARSAQETERIRFRPRNRWRLIHLDNFHCLNYTVIKLTVLEKDAVRRPKITKYTKIITYYVVFSAPKTKELWERKKQQDG